MTNSYFKFKQFTINHASGVMKVGTDGVLLGAYVDAKNYSNILDIGSGTGLVALMLAQKSNALITTIDINPLAFANASQNISNSPWCSRINVKNIPLQKFVPTEKFDLIVSNPPFFDTDVRAPNQERAIARHNLELKHEDVLDFSNRFLLNDGHLILIYPADIADEFVVKALNYGLFLQDVMNIKGHVKSKVVRKIVKFGRTKGLNTESTICIEKENRHDYTDEYKQLTKDYYLKF